MPDPNDPISVTLPASSRRSLDTIGEFMRIAYDATQSSTA